MAIAKDVLKIDSDLIPKIATGFGGGISRREYVYGAVGSVVMGFGLKSFIRTLLSNFILNQREHLYNK